jgi:transposase
MRLQGITAQEFRFRTIVRLYEEGKAQVAIAQTVGCSQCWVSKILQRYREEGEVGLQVKGKAPGKPAGLGDFELAQLRMLLLQGALIHGFTTDNWTRERIAALIQQKFNVSYHPAHISRLMKKIGFSLQKPQAKSYRKDPQQVHSWRTEQLPELKKSKK